MGKNKTNHPTTGHSLRAPFLVSLNSEQLRCTLFSRGCCLDHVPYHSSSRVSHTPPMLSTFSCSLTLLILSVLMLSTCILRNSYYVIKEHFEVLPFFSEISQYIGKTLKTGSLLQFALLVWRLLAVKYWASGVDRDSSLFSSLPTAVIGSLSLCSPIIFSFLFSFVRPFFFFSLKFTPSECDAICLFSLLTSLIAFQIGSSQ